MSRKMILTIGIVFAALFVFVPLSFSASGKSGKGSLSVSKSADVDKKAPRAQIENKYGVAVIIGNRNYKSKDVPIVDYAVSDARIVKKYVQKTLGCRPGNIIYLENATQARLNSVFGVKGDHRAKLYSYLRKNKSDVFVYYSGHGAPDVKTKTGYFVPVDCDPSTVRFNGYSLKTFYDNLTADSRAIVLVPSSVRTQSHLARGDYFRFPTKSEQASGIHLKVGTLPGHRKDREAIMVVATKIRQPLPPKLDNTPYYTADAVGSWLVDIPLSERTIKVLPYEIVSR